MVATEVRPATPRQETPGEQPPAVTTPKDANASLNGIFASNVLESLRKILTPEQLEAIVRDRKTKNEWLERQEDYKKVKEQQAIGQIRNLDITPYQPGSPVELIAPKPPSVVKIPLPPDTEHL